MPTVIFSGLGIAPTVDQKAIRRAYATALKKIDQAADPEGFAALRLAYERARAWAQHQSATDATPLAAAPAQQSEPGLDPSDSLQPETQSQQHSYAPAMGDDPTAPIETRHQPRNSQEATSPQAIAAEAQPYASTPLPNPAEQAEAVEHWIRTLMATPDDRVSQVLNSALLDERLAHLEAKEHLSVSLAQALRARPDGRLALFNTALHVLDWGGLDTPFPNDPQLSHWLTKLQDQQEQYAHLSPAQQAPLNAALALARRQATPSRIQAMLYGRNFKHLYETVPELLALDLGRERIEAWRDAAERKGRVQCAWTWAASHKLRIALTIICIFGLISIFTDTRDRTTYSANPAEATLADGHITLIALPAATESLPCKRQPMQAAPLGCPESESLLSQPEPWPTDTPKKLVIVEPPNLRYPLNAKLQGIGGQAWVRVLLDERGKVQKTALQFSSNNAELDIAAVNAARTARLLPATRDGLPIASQTTLVFHYKPRIR